MSDISSPGSGGTAKPWRTTASDNNYAPPDGAPEGWQGEEVNNVVREIMTAVRDWYGEPEWQWVLFDSGLAGSDSVVSYSGPQTITISEMTDEAVDEMFPKGARIRLSRLDVVDPTDCFVAATPGPVAADVVSIAIDGATLPVTATFATNGVALHVARDATAIAFGGYGLESARDAAIPNDQVPDGMVWVTTDIGELGMVQVGKEGAWVSIAPPGSFTDDGATLSIKAGAGSDATLSMVSGATYSANIWTKETDGLVYYQRSEDGIPDATGIGREQLLGSSSGGRYWQIFSAASTQEETPSSDLEYTMYDETLSDEISQITAGTYVNIAGMCVIEIENTSIGTPPTAGIVKYRDIRFYLGDDAEPKRTLFQHDSGYSSAWGSINMYDFPWFGAGRGSLEDKNFQNVIGYYDFSPLEWPATPPTKLVITYEKSSFAPQAEADSKAQIVVVTTNLTSDDWPAPGNNISPAIWVDQATLTTAS